MGAFLTYALNKNRETLLELSLQCGLSFFSDSHFLLIGFTRLPSAVLGATKNLTVAEDFCGDASNGIFKGCFLKLALPHDYDRPSFGFQLAPDFLVSGLVAGDFGSPEVSVSLGDGVKSTVSVAVPKAAVDEYGSAILGKDDVRGARKPSVVHSITKPLSPKGRTQTKLRLRGSGANGGHIAMALGWCEAISHFASQYTFFSGNTELIN